MKNCVEREIGWEARETFNNCFWPCLEYTKAWLPFNLMMSILLNMRSTVSVCKKNIFFWCVFESNSGFWHEKLPNLEWLTFYRLGWLKFQRYQNIERIFWAKIGLLIQCDRCAYNIKDAVQNCQGFKALPLLPESWLVFKLYLSFNWLYLEFMITYRGLVRFVKAELEKFVTHKDDLWVTLGSPIKEP